MSETQDKVTQLGTTEDGGESYLLSRQPGVQNIQPRTHAYNRLIKASNYLPSITFDDVLLVPQYSAIRTRASISLQTRLTNLRTIDIPLIAANMDSVCEEDMMVAMFQQGGIGILHRYMNFGDQITKVELLRHKLTGFSDVSPLAVAVGVKNGSLDHVEELVDAGVSILVIDVAHGHHEQVKKSIQYIKQMNMVAEDGLPVEVIVGNIATEVGARFLIEAGADAIKVGVGSGSICTTRIVTGHGFPQLSAIAQIAPHAFRAGIPIIADGGIRNSGDIVKALAAGASSVMLGSILSGTDEAPGEIFYNSEDTRSVSSYKLYRGMASKEAQDEFYGNYKYAPEGVTTIVEYKGSVVNVLRNLIGGIRSGLSYSGALTIPELQERGDWVLVSNAGVDESKSVKPYRK